jgi:hypothetical protein
MPIPSHDVTYLNAIAGGESVEEFQLHHDLGKESERQKEPW